MISRFTPTNICDYIVYNHINSQLLLLELKTTKQKSMPFANLKKHQIDDLHKASKFVGVFPYFIFEFRAESLCYAILTTEVYNYYNQAERKSFPTEWCEKVGILIPSNLKRIHSNYQVDVLLR